MRVLFLDQFSGLGGAQLCLLDLVQAMVRRGWEPHVAAPGGGPLAARARTCGARVHVLTMAGYSQGRKTIADAVQLFFEAPVLGSRIKDLGEEIKPRLIYINGPRLLPAAALARLDMPVVFHSHNRIGAPSRRLAQAALWALNGRVIAASRFVAKQWTGAHVIPGGVEGPNRELRAHKKKGRPRIGMIGRIGPQKRQLEFVNAAREIDADFILCGDTVFGGTVEQEYKRRVLGSAPANVTWLGWCGSVYEVLSTLDLLVVPSSDEGGVPRVILEAFSCGVPVLACASGAVVEAVEPEVTGFVLPSAHPGEIARRIREVLASPETMSRVAISARRLWRERFTAGRFCEDTMGLLLGTCFGDRTPLCAT